MLQQYLFNYNLFNKLPQECRDVRCQEFRLPWSTKSFKDGSFFHCLKVFLSEFGVLEFTNFLFVFYNELCYRILSSYLNCNDKQITYLLVKKKINNTVRNKASFFFQMKNKLIQFSSYRKKININIYELGFCIVIPLSLKLLLQIIVSLFKINLPLLIVTVNGKFIIECQMFKRERSTIPNISTSSYRPLTINYFWNDINSTFAKASLTFHLFIKIPFPCLA